MSHFKQFHSFIKDSVIEKNKFQIHLFNDCSSYVVTGNTASVLMILYVLYIAGIRTNPAISLYKFGPKASVKRPKKINNQHNIF